MPISDTLRQRLDAGAAWDGDYGDGLSNHLPMALIALERLGADAAHLHAWEHRYAAAAPLNAARPPQPWPAGDPWPDRLGDTTAWPAYRGLFAQWLVLEPPDDVLGQVLPQLMPGCGGAAFHGLIRTAYAVQAGHAGELVDGLAHWAAHHQPLGALPEAAPAGTDPLPLLRRLRAGNSGARLITGRLADAAQGGEVNRQIAGLQIEADTPQRLARAAAFAYAHSGNFVALHLLTSNHALQVLTRFFIDDAAATDAWRWYWQAFAHGVVAARLQALPPPARLDWPALLAQALASDDEHVIKLVDSARELARADAAHTAAAARPVAKTKPGADSEDPLWRLAASRAVTPVPAP